MGELAKQLKGKKIWREVRWGAETAEVAAHFSIRSGQGKRMQKYSYKMQHINPLMFEWNIFFRIMKIHD